MSESKEKRGRGRPRKHNIEHNKVKKKRGRGRPRKHEVIESHVYMNSEGHKRDLSKPIQKKVDHLYLFDKVMQYLVKVNLIHHSLYHSESENRPIFHRLKDLDMQIIDICKAALGIVDLE